MIATIVIAAIADKNRSAIAAIDGLHMIAAIAEWRTRVPGCNNIVRAIPHIQHGGCESSTPTWGVLSCNLDVFQHRRRRERQRTLVQDLNWISPRLLSSSWFSCTPLYIPLKICCKDRRFLYFLHKRCQVDCFPNVCVGSHLEKRELTQCILVLLLSLRSLESGFHMIATIAEVELKSISAIVVATIAGEWFPYDRCDRWTFFSAVVAIIWKPGYMRLKWIGNVARVLRDCSCSPELW